MNAKVAAVNTLPTFRSQDFKHTGLSWESRKMVIKIEYKQNEIKKPDALERP